MPRRKAASPVIPERFPLSAAYCEQLALCIGHEQLPRDCAAELGELLNCHLQSERVLRTQKSKTTAGNVVAAIDKVRSAVQELIALDSGIDADTRRDLKPTADAFLAATEARLNELSGTSRVYPHKELLLMTCPLLQRIFEKHALRGFNTRGNLRRFALLALKAADIATPSVDEEHLDRLDKLLDAELHPG